MLTISVGLWLCGGCSDTDGDWFIMGDYGHERLGSSGELLLFGSGDRWWRMVVAGPLGCAVANIGFDGAAAAVY